MGSMSWERAHRAGAWSCVFKGEKEFSRQKVTLCKDKSVSTSTEVCKGAACLLPDCRLGQGKGRSQQEGTDNGKPR